MSYCFDLIHDTLLSDVENYFRSFPISRFTDPMSAYSHLAPPFSLSFTTFHPNTETPLLYAVLCPDCAFYSVSTQDDFEYIKDYYYPMHCHNTFELIYIMEGEFFQRIEQTRHKYTPDSCCLLTPSVFHIEDYNYDCRFATLSLSADFLNNLLFKKGNQYFETERHLDQTPLSQFIMQNMNNNLFEEKNYMDFISQEGYTQVKETIHRTFDQLTQLLIDPHPGASFTVQSLIYQIFHLLDCSDCFHTTPISLGTPAESQLFSAVSKRMKETNGRISRAELVKEFKYSGTYINEVVKKFSGLSIFHYGITFTMQEAVKLLTTTDLSVSEIAQILSFSDRTHFYRLFRESFGMTPREYRKAHFVNHP